MAFLENIQQEAADEKLRTSIKKRLTQKSARTLFDSLKAAAVEKDVENAWRKIFVEYFVDKDKYDNYTISSPLDVDGFISADEGNLVFALRLLMEFKNGTDLTKSYDRARIMCQCIHYMKKFQEENKKLPTVIVGADEDQAFVLIAKKFYKYLDKDYFWDVAPSSAYKKDTKLMQDLSNDANLSVYPFQFVGGSFKERYSSLLDLFESIESITQDNGEDTYRVKVSPATILSMFDEFNHLAFRDSSKVNPVQAVNMFMQMLTGKNEDDYYFIPRNHNLYHMPGDKKVRVYGAKIEAFLSHYDRNFTVKQIDELTSIADRLIEANERRYKGDFWTPDIWAKRADEMMSNYISEDYKETSLVWDCAAGVRNLTRNYVYSDLYISTYHQDEIDLGHGYNPEAKAAFQYDFLNDDVNLSCDNSKEWKMPDNLFNALLEAGKSGKRVVFYTNPPYGTATNVKADGSSKANIAKSAVNKLMKKNSYGKSAQQLYCQFFVRIMEFVRQFKLTNVYIAFFTNARFLCGGDTYEKFNNKFFKEFEHVGGNLLNAGEFNDTASTWPITFSVYKLKDDQDETIPTGITIQCEKSALNDKSQMVIESITKHTMIKVYKKDSLSEWVREPLKEVKLDNQESGAYPQLSSAMKESKGKRPSGKLLKGSLGYMVSNSNNIGEGTYNGGVWVVSGSAYKGHGFNVVPQNFDRAVVNFAARRSIDPTWYNAQDNYHFPNMNSSLYEEYVNDALVFSLFDNQSYQAAYRHKGWSNGNIPDKWENQWFWLTKDQVIEMIQNSPELNDMMKDVKTDSDRFVAKQIQERSFSEEATKVLEAVNHVWKDTLKARATLDEDNPELYLNAWDAGWFQIKQANKKYPSDHFNQFKQAFSELKAKIKKNTYNLGMLVYDKD